MLKNKKSLILLGGLVASLAPLSSCNSNTLLFLNWGEYISDDLLEAFEQKYHVNVLVDIAESNELFYAKLKSGTTKYDLCCPTDYMIEKMYMNNLIQKIDFSKLKNFKNGIFMDEVNSIKEEMNESMKEIKDDYVDGEINSYHIPYFWGTFGLMYNRNSSYFKDENENGTPDIFEKYNAWDLYFSDSSIPSIDAMPSDLRVGMYDAVRFSYAASMIYDQKNPNAVLNNENQNKFKDIISRRQYSLWSGDQLKHQIVADNLDFAFNYTGDCLDMAYSKIQEGKNFSELSFYTYTPSTTIAHIDSLVIPSESRHVDLAHKFIDFLLDPVNEYINARNVGYCPPLQETYDMIVNKTNPDIEKYPYADYGNSEEEIHWRDNWAIAIKTTYPLDENMKSLNKGIPLTCFDSDELKILNNIVNNIKAS